MPVRTNRLASATAIMRAAVGGGRNAEARRQGFRAGDARVRERRLNRAAAGNERGAEMLWSTNRELGDGMRRDQAEIGSRRRSAANSAGATAYRASSRSRRMSRR